MTDGRYAFIWSTIALLVGVGLAIATWFGPPQPGGDSARLQTIVVDGEARTYRLVVPDQTSDKPLPLVLAFHGIGDSTDAMAAYSGLDSLADAEHFVLVYPIARRGMWLIPETEQGDIDAPDVRFVDALVADLQSRIPIDPGRIYAVGMSNGGTFVQLLAAHRPEMIAAVAASSGPPPPGARVSDSPFPIMLIVGANEPPTMLAAIRAAAHTYRERGHEVEFLTAPDIAHTWARDANPAIWQFLSRHRLRAAKDAEGVSQRSH